MTKLKSDWYREWVEAIGWGTIVIGGIWFLVNWQLVLMRNHPTIQYRIERQAYKEFCQERWGYGEENEFRVLDCIEHKFNAE